MRIFLLNKNVEKPENLSDFLREKYKSFYGQLQLIEGKFYKTQFLNLANEHLKNFKLVAAITLLVFRKPVFLKYYITKVTLRENFSLMNYSIPLQK